MRWSTPDWIVLPAGNLGNTSALGKALKELNQLGLLENVPRIASVQAEGADPFYRLWRGKHNSLEPLEAHTVASAIQIGNPVSWMKAIESIRFTDGEVERVSDEEIMDAKAVVDASGVGCEPASAASVAGARKLAEQGVIDRGEEVLCILTGHLLKDPDTTVRYHMGKLHVASMRANKLVAVEPDIGSIEEVLRGSSIARAPAMVVTH